jgi:hypothetical protein
VLFSEHFRRHNVSSRCLDLILHSCDDVAVAGYHGIKARPCDLRVVILLLGTDLGIHHAGAPEKLGLGPGIKQVTVAPLSRGSFRNANEKESRNALLLL